jgi:hypothetical protein
MLYLGWIWLLSWTRPWTRRSISFEPLLGRMGTRAKNIADAAEPFCRRTHYPYRLLGPGLGEFRLGIVTTVPMDFVDFTATNFPVRFYRALSP